MQKKISITRLKRTVNESFCRGADIVSSGVLHEVTRGSIQPVHEGPSTGQDRLALPPSEGRRDESGEFDVRFVGKPVRHRNGVIGDEVGALVQRCFFQQKVPEVIRYVQFFILRCSHRHRTQNWS